MSLGRAVHQQPGQPGRTERGPGEALPGIGRDEARLAGQGSEGLGRERPADAGAREREYGPGVEARQGQSRQCWGRWTDDRSHDGVPQDALAPDQGRPANGTLPAAAGTPGADPKSGGGMRELGIPTVIDRLIQQALLQVLQPSDRSDVFRTQLRLSTGPTCA
jgi:RNA-directed DNA polymerase